MKCMTSEEIMKYLDQELMEAEKWQIEKHLEGCIHCQISTKSYEEDLKTFDQVVMHVNVPDSFVGDVMATLLAQPPIQTKNHCEKTEACRKDQYWMKKISYTAAGLVLATSLGSFVSPTFAEYVKSVPHYVKYLFFGASDQVDEGVHQAAVNGYAMLIDKSVTDQGITLHVNEVFADPSRIYVKYTLEKNGKLFISQKLQGDTKRNSVISIEDTSGQFIRDRQEWRPQEGFYAFNLQGNEPKQMNIHINISKIDATKGKWELIIPINTERGHQDSQITEINQQYISPEGIHLSLQNIQSLPSVTRLQIETSMTDERLKIIQEMITQHKSSATNLFNYGIYYHILDENGKVVASYDDELDTDVNDEQNRLLNYDNQVAEEKNKFGGKVKQTHAFIPIHDHKKLTFKLMGIYTQEQADFSQKFNPKALAIKPLLVSHGDNTFILRSFRLKTDSKQEEVAGMLLNQRGAILEMDGRLAKNLVFIDSWVIKDENGEEFQPEVATQRTKNPDGTISFKAWLIMRDMQKEPSQLTISFDSIKKLNRDVQWEVPIALKKE